MNCSVEHKDAFRAEPIGAAVAETFDALTSQSVADQQRIEDADDLIADLEEAFQEAMSATGWHSKNGGGSVHGNDGSAGLTDAAARREDELLRRIAALEAQLEGLHNVKSPPR